MDNITHFGDCRESMRAMIAAGINVQTCVTSPPYWGLRDYGHPGQLGLEETPEQYISNMVEVFRLVRDLLADDGTLWMQMGDCYRNKQLVGQPWRLAFALQADGWMLRRDICWYKPNAMPETVHDRPATAHEYIFLLSKTAKYFYDAGAIKEPATGTAHARGAGVHAKIRVPTGWDTDAGAHGNIHKNGRSKSKVRPRQNESFSASVSDIVETRNKRSVWIVPAKGYSGAHFATFPPDLIMPCILAGSRPGDVVLDPFMGSGTTAEVAQSLGRRWIGCEINQDYEPLQKKRTEQAGLALA